jgi:GNAT superfamily N-acetyltransferase
MVDIVKINKSNSAELERFIDFPHDLYADDPLYVPMVFVEQEALLNPKKSPFFQHSTADYFLAKQNGKIVGRIAAIRNNNHLAFSGKKEGFFGFFDVVNDFSVAKKLLDTAKNWLHTEGLEKMIGPSNFSTNETCGLLVDNFDEPSFIMNTYNAPYYVDLLTQYGFTKLVDLLCYELITQEMPQDVVEFGQKLETRLVERGITIRKINMKQYQKEIENFLPIYNASWSENTGFVPMTDAEIRQIGKDLKNIIDPDFVYFAEKDGQTIGVSLTIPNVNEILLHVKRGRLFPTGALKILFGLKKIKTVRVFALGTLKEYRRMGIDVCFYVRNIVTAREKGIVRAEASWILEDNIPMNRALEHINAKVYRKYRLYEKAI